MSKGGPRGTEKCVRSTSYAAYAGRADVVPRFCGTATETPYSLSHGGERLQLRHLRHLQVHVDQTYVFPVEEEAR